MDEKLIKKLTKKLDNLLREIEILTASQQMAVERFNESNQINNTVKKDALDTIAEIKAAIGKD